MLCKALPPASRAERSRQGPRLCKERRYSYITTMRLKPAYSTNFGRMYVARAEDALRCDPLVRSRGKVQLIFTSPPFPLNRKKAYGNLTGTRYVTWLAGFAELFRDYLTRDGSIVLELGNAWNPGQPTMSTLPLEALLHFMKAGHLYLCQEFIHFNPARLPSPVQWVNVKRIRVKDAFTRLWWLSPSTEPKASNERVLIPYSKSMKRLIKRQTYNGGRRPSQWFIGEESFLRQHSGAIPPNVLTIANTASADGFAAACRKRGVVKHPARMPDKLAEFFVKLLTDEGDIVLDPFAGSNTTGCAAERLKRRWLSVEADEQYATTSRLRFPTSG